MTIVIKSNTRTEADDADAVTFGPADGRVINLARITTAGARAEAIRGSGDHLDVLNAGSIETKGDGATGIRITGDDARIVNAGTVHVGGQAIFDPTGQADPIYADGIDAYGKHAVVLNFGTITMTGGDNAAIAGVGEGATVRNYGSVTGTGDYDLGVGVSGANGTAGNDGRITVTGEGATGLYAFNGPGDTLANKGSIAVSGDGATGVFLGGATSSAANAGSVSAIGTGVFGLFAVADGATLRNSGTVTIASTLPDGASSPGSFAMAALGDAAKLVNVGQVRTSGTSAIGVEGIDHADIRNAGAVVTTGINSAGLRIGLASADDIAANDASVTNSGTVTTRGNGSVGVQLIGDHNHLVNAGQIATGGGTATSFFFGTLPAAGVLVSGDGVDIVNRDTGAISATAKGGVAVILNALVPAGGQVPAGASSFVNHGTVSGDTAIRGGAGVETISNDGRIRGDVDLGDGNDVFTALSGGRFSGMLTLGHGDDLLVMKRGGGHVDVADFTAGAVPEDRIDVSAFGYHTLDQLRAVSTQVGDDTVIRLAAGDVVTLHHVLMGSLANGNFIFG